MEQSPTSNALQTLLNDLFVQPGVSGAFLQVKGTVLVHNLPYSDDRVANLAGRVDHLVSSYQGVARNVWQICAGCENFRLLILCNNALRLGMLLLPDTDPTLAAGRGMNLLMEAKSLETKPATVPILIAKPPEAATPPPAAAAASTTPQIPREDFERIVLGLLSRVTGSAQASKLIQREFIAHKLNGSTRIDPKDARLIGLSVLDAIPNRGKRAALASEFLNALNL